MGKRSRRAGRPRLRLTPPRALNSRTPTRSCTAASSTARRVLLLGATGTAGRATSRALVAAGHDVTCLVRSQSGHASAQPDALPASTRIEVLDITSEALLRHDVFQNTRYDVIVSCLASRTGAPADAWAIDHAAHSTVLRVAREAGVGQMVLLSAICVQRPKLAFQHAKLAFERELIDSGLDYSIVRPTAFFKSLSGQVERVRRGKPFLVFGDGTATACKPISDGDLGRYMAECVVDPSRRNRVLPIGGPGEAITPLEQGEHLFELLGKSARFKRVPIALLDGIIATLSALGRVSGHARAKAELARIGRYYATESMLVYDHDAGRYDADATPSTGTETLFDYYAKLVAGSASAERGEHAVL